MALSEAEELELLELEEQETAQASPSLMQNAVQGAKSAITAPIRAGRALLTDPTKVAAKTPILPLAGSVMAGPAGGAVGEGLRQMASITKGGPTPTPAQSALQMGLAAFGPGRARAAGSAVKGAAKRVGDVFAPTVEKAGAELLPVLEKEGLKDIRPIIFNKGEREAAVQYAENQAKLAAKKALTPQQLQEARSTMKDILDNRVVMKDSPTGQIVARSKEAVTNALSEAKPAVGKSLRRLGRAYEAAPTKKFLGKVSGEARRAAINAALTTLGLGGAAAAYKALQ